MSIEVRRAADRFVTRAQGRTTWHSFSFGAHYDPRDVGFGVMTALNDEHLAPGTGYPDHPHVDVEIVTVVLGGALHHRDSSGHDGVLGPGSVSRTSAGSGIVHAEVAAPGLGPGVETRFVQTWLRPDEAGGVPSYASADVGVPEGLVEVVGPDGALGVGTTGARLLLAVGADEVVLPDAPLLHLLAADGGVQVGQESLAGGDAARLTDEGARTVRLERPGLLLVWSLDGP